MASIIVGMADLKVARASDTLTTLGLGSCVGICLFDQLRQICGMAHIMLPDSGGAAENRMKFADTGIVDLLTLMIRTGASKASVFAKLAGGARMFGTAGTNSILNIGDRNIDASIRILGQLGIPIKAQDVGGRHGRTIVISALTGQVMIKTIGHGESVI